LKDLEVKKQYQIEITNRFAGLQSKLFAYDYFLTFCFSRGEVLSPRPTPKLEDHPLSAVAIAYSIYSQRRSISEAVLPSSM
jgi:hypothetical protein